MKNQPVSLLKTFLFAILTVFGLCTSARADITTGLLSYYKLDETSGLTAADATGYSPAAVLNNFFSDPAQWVAGWTNGALQFDGTQFQYATIDDSTNGLNFALMANPAFTLATWVQGATTQPNGAGIITRGYGHGGEAYLVDVYNGYYLLGVRDATGTATTIQQSIPALSCNGSWQHIVAVYDSTLTTNHMKIYVNSLLAYQQSGPTNLNNVIHDVSLGAREDTISSGYNIPFTGALDDVHFYARALSAGDVLELYNAAAKAPSIVTQPQGATNYVGDGVTFTVTAQGTLPFTYQWWKNGTSLLAGATNSSYSIANVQFTNAGSYSVVVSNVAGGTTSDAAVLVVSNPPPNIISGLVAYFKMDESTGTLAADATGTTAGANIQNFTTDAQWLPTGGRTNGAYNFYGLTDPLNPLSGQYMDVNDSGALDFSAMATPALTVAAWIKTPPGFTEPGGAGLVARGYGRGGEQYVLDLFDNGPRFFVRDTASNTYIARGDDAGPLGTNGFHLNNGAWAHLVGVLDPTVSPALIKLFVNGQFVTSSPAAPSFLGSTSDTTIGARQDSSISGYSLPFTGEMDDVRIYNRALTPSDVQALYASVGNAPPSLVVPVANTTNFVLSASILSVTADGTVPFSYQWQWYGTNLPDQTNSVFSIAVSQLTNSGRYSVVVTNLYGTISSTGYLAIIDLATNDYTNSLVAEWSFDETSGTTAADTAPFNAVYHSSQNPLNLVNFPADNSQWVTMARSGGRALRFNAVADDVNGGQNDYCETAGGLAMPYNYNLFTFAFWVKLDSATYGTNPRVITPVGAPWVLWSSAGGMRMYNATGGTNPALNKWTHYALTYDRGNNRYSCYVNGVKTVNNVAPAAKTATTAATLWVVGHNETTTQNADYFRGQLDDLRVYNRMLTDSQVSALYTSYPAFIQIVADPQSVSVRERDSASFTVAGDSSSAISYRWQKNGVDIPGATTATYTINYASLADTGAHYHAILTSTAGTVTSADAVLTVTALPPADFTSSLVVHYAFDEASGSVAYDSSGNGYDATLYNWAPGSAQWEPGILGNALHFNAAVSNNYVLTPPLSFPNDTINFTFTFWAKRDTNAIYNNPRFFATANLASWVLWEQSGAPTGVGFWHGTAGTPAPEAAAWHHYTVVFNRTTSLYNVYVDGVRKVAGGVPTNPATEADPTGYGWVIGHRENISPMNDLESFRGWLDDMRIYNRQFTINDAEALYQAANIPPLLTLQASGGTLTFSWPSWASGYTLKSANSLAAGVSWTAAPGSPVLVNAIMYQTNSVGPGTMFFRLAK